MAKATCSIDACSRAVVRYGWCYLHYGNSRETGDPLTPGVCDVSGCDIPTHGTPWCSTHASRWYRYGDFNYVTAPTERNVVRNRIVKVCVGCGEEFERKASKAASFNYCSLACKRENTRTPKIAIQCETCGKVVRAYASQVRGLTPEGTRPWCSRDCQMTAAASTSCCVNCRKVYTLPSNMMRVRRSCSQECSQKLRWQWRSAFGTFKQKVESGYRTDIEALAEEVLIELGIRYEFEKRVGRFWIDFALTDLGIGLECDGWRHESKVDRDAERDAVLLTRGWRVVRIPDATLRADARGAILTAIPELLNGQPYQVPHKQLSLLDYPTTA